MVDGIPAYGRSRVAIINKIIDNNLEAENVKLHYELRSIKTQKSI